MSYTAAELRLSKLGILEKQKKTETVYLTEEESLGVYFADTSFRKLVDDNRIIFAGNRCVINDPMYIEPLWEDVPKYCNKGNPYKLTDYALSHPDEAFVSFCVEHTHSDAEDDVLQSRTDSHLKAQLDAFRKNFPVETERLKRHAGKFEKMFAATEQQSFNSLAKEMIIYRYGSMEDFDPKIASDWNPEEAMPETHDKYFSDRSHIDILEKKRNALLKSNDPAD